MSDTYKVLAVPAVVVPQGVMIEIQALGNWFAFVAVAASLGRVIAFCYLLG